MIEEVCSYGPDTSAGEASALLVLSPVYKEIKSSRGQEVKRVQRIKGGLRGVENVKSV